MHILTMYLYEEFHVRIQMSYRIYFLRLNCFDIDLISYFKNQHV